MATGSFDFAPLLPAGLPPAAARWTGLAKYSFVGGNNDPDQVPVDGLIDAVNAVLKREGKSLATYGLASGPQGYRPLREFLVGKLKRDAGIACTADDILIVSGSLQALDLVNHTLLARGDTIITEQDSYQGALNRLTRLGVNMVGIPLDGDGMRMDALAAALEDLKRKNIQPKYIYTIPTVQNPTGTIMPEARRLELLKLSQQYGVPIFEDDCYADLIWDGERPPAIYAMSYDRRRDPHRLVFQIDRAGVAGRLHRRALGRDVAHAGAEDRRRLRRAGADGAGGILRAAFCHPCAEADQRAARKTRHADGSAQRTIRHRGGVRGSQRRHLPVGETARQCRYAKTVPVGARRRRRHQSGAGMVHRQGLRQKPDAAVLRQPLAARKSARASQSWPRYAARNSACRSGVANVERATAS